MDPTDLPSSFPDTASRARSGRTVLLLNTNAGGGRAAQLKRPIERWLASEGERAMLFVSDSAKLSTQIIDALPNSSRVIVLGGDGSLGQLLPALHAGAHTAGLVPVGTGNDAAAGLGLAKLRWRDALAHALRSPASPIDLGEVRWTNARGFEQRALFASSLCSGFDAAVNRQAAVLPRWLFGKPRYLAATLLELLALPRYDLQVLADGLAVHAGPTLLASALNTRTYGGGMPIAPAAQPDDGQLDLILAEGMGLTRVLGLLPRMLAGRHLGQPGVLHRHCTRIELKANAPIPLAADGEVLGEAVEVRVTVLPSALQFIRRSVR